MSVEFEPVKLGRRGRRFDPISLGAALVVLGLAAALLKPWGGAPDTTSGSIADVAVADASPAAIASGDLTGPHATAAVPIPSVIRASTASTLTWTQLEPIVHRHETWGIRAIVRVLLNDTPANARQRWVERWYPLGVNVDPPAPTRVDSNDRAISALGLTFPPAHTPLDVRFWRETRAGLEWVDTDAVDSVPSGGAFLYVRPGVISGSQRTWEPGSYRIDALVDGSISRFAMTIPNRFSNVPAPTDRPSLRDQRPSIEPAASAIYVQPGLFATVDDAVVPIPATEGPPLDEVGAWLNLDPGSSQRPRSFVGAVYMPRASAIGVAVAGRSVVTASRLVRLAPGPAPELPMQTDRTLAGAPISNVLFHAPDGGAWPAGVYRIDVAWADADGPHEASWHLELRPGPVRQSAPLLAAARGWARFAGASGVILGTAEPLVGGSTADVIRLVPLRPDTAAYPAATGVGCGGTVIETSPGILGFAYPADHYASAVRARIMLPFLRRDDQVVMTAAFGVPGLILAAPARIATLPAATYEFIVGSGETAQSYALCLGMQVFGD